MDENIKTAEKDCIKMHNESEILDINRKTGLKILKFRKNRVICKKVCVNLG